MHSGIKKLTGRISSSPKYLIGLGVVFFLRLIPHPPNVEPIMTTMMPYAKKWGKYSGLLFCFLSIILFDLLTGTIGQWTIMTAITYSLLGLLAGIYLKNKKNKIRYYLGFSVIGTIIYDAITGIGTGMLFFKQPFMVTFLGQIPFTAYHLAGNIVLSLTLCPVLYKWVVSNPSLELSPKTTTN